MVVTLQELPLTVFGPAELVQADAMDRLHHADAPGVGAETPLPFNAGGEDGLGLRGATEIREDAPELKAREHRLGAVFRDVPAALDRRGKHLDGLFLSLLFVEVDAQIHQRLDGVGVRGSELPVAERQRLAVALLALLVPLQVREAAGDEAADAGNL